MLTPVGYNKYKNGPTQLRIILNRIIIDSTTSKRSFGLKNGSDNDINFSFEYEKGPHLKSQDSTKKLMIVKTKNES